ncbi:MAG: hypothetical protein E7166_01335 [Firmicutes bacterium]|nr:hypothetical protein [Bacillota bacterium]
MISNNINNLKTLKNDIKNNNLNGLRLLKEKTNNRYLKEKNFVLFDVILKSKDKSNITGVRTSVGYILPNNEIYDFISKKIYKIYKLYDKSNKEKEGNYALISNIMFENSTKRIKLNYANLQEIEDLLKKYIIEYNSGIKEIKKQQKELKNEEHIPRVLKDYQN